MANTSQPTADGWQRKAPTLDFVKVDNLRENRIYCWQLLNTRQRTDQGMEMTTAIPAQLSG